MKLYKIFSIFFLSLIPFGLLKGEKPWTEERFQLATEGLGPIFETLSTYKIFKYPTLPLKDELLNSFSDGKVILFGYGSLVNHASASRTLSQEAVDTMRSAVAFGLKRIFNREVTKTDRWGPRERPNDTGMLNVARGDDPYQMVNGVVFKLGAVDLEKLIEREVGYDLVPIVVANWDELVDQTGPLCSARIAYTFMATDQLREGKQYVSSHVNPVPGYAKASKEGALDFGEAFMNFWSQTTFLADGKTSFIEWEKHPEIDMGC